MVSGAQPVVELGSRFHQPVPRSRPAALAAAQSQSHFAALAKFRWPRSNAAPRNWCCTAASTTPIAASANISMRIAPGARGTPEFCGRARWHISPRNSDCTSRFPFIPAASAFSPAITSRAHPTWEFRWSAIGLFYGQGYFRQRLDKNGWQQEEYLQTDVSQMPMEPAIGANGEPVTVQIETRSGSIRAKVWRLKVGRCDLLLLDSNVEGNAPEDRELTSRLYGGDDRFRIRQELLLGVGGFRALKAMGITPERAALERRPQRFCGARSDSQPHGGRRPGFQRRRPARFARSRVHHAHAGPGRPRPLRRRPDRRASGTAARSPGHFARLADVAGPRESRQFGGKFLHDGAGPETVAARQRRIGAARRSVPRHVDRSLYPGRSEEAVPIRHITNGVHVPTWLAPQMFRLYDRHLGTGWPSTAANRKSGKELKTSTTGNSGRRTSA